MRVLSPSNTTPASIAAAIAILQAGGEGFRIPLLRAVLRREIALGVASPGRQAPLRELNRTGKPAILLILDDYDHPGPPGWACAPAAMRWARRAMLHGTGGIAEHYELAVKAALVARRLILVETASAQLDAWSALALSALAPGRVLRIQPPPGGVHPVAPPRGTVH